MNVHFLFNNNVYIDEALVGYIDPIGDGDAAIWISKKKFARLTAEGEILISGKLVGYIEDNGDVFFGDKLVGEITPQNDIKFYGKALG